MTLNFLSLLSNGRSPTLQFYFWLKVPLDQVPQQHPISYAIPAVLADPRIQSPRLSFQHRGSKLTRTKQFSLALSPGIEVLIVEGGCLHGQHRII